MLPEGKIFFSSPVALLKHPEKIRERKRKGEMKFKEVEEYVR
jgi:hypothetical protein